MPIRVVKLPSMVVTRLQFCFALFAIVKAWFAKIQKQFFEELLGYFNSEGQFFHCYTGTLRDHKLLLPCSVLWSDNRMIVKACSRNTTCEATNQIYKENINLKLRLSFQGLPLFPGQGKSAKCSYFPRGCCFTHSPLIFATQSLVILLSVTFCINLFDKNLWTLGIT